MLKYETSIAKVGVDTTEKRSPKILKTGSLKDPNGGTDGSPRAGSSRCGACTCRPSSLIFDEERLYRRIHHEKRTRFIEVVMHEQTDLVELCTRQ